jgi:hypothetical protein
VVNLHAAAKDDVRLGRQASLLGFDEVGHLDIVECLAIGDHLGRNAVVACESWNAHSSPTDAVTLHRSTAVVGASTLILEPLTGVEMRDDRDTVN